MFKDRLVALFSIRNLRPFRHVKAGAITMCMGAGMIVLTGEVVPGVECRSIRLDDGRIVALSRLSNRFSVGDRVTVTGTGYAGSSTCQQEVLIVKSADPAD